MSQRSYIIVNGEKVYDWDETKHSEYVCDVCSIIIEPEQPQIHLYIRRGMWQTADGIKNIEWFGIELHEDCISMAGTKLAQKIEELS